MTGLIREATLKDAYVAGKTPGVRHILLAGPPGVGKTTFAFEFAKLMKRPAFKWQLHPESTPPEGYGFHVPAEQTFRWEPGPVDLAYSKGGVLILDEIVEASGPVKTALYGPLDAGAGGVISYVGRTFKPHKDYMCVATMNGAPWEGGLPEALLDRFDATFLILKPGEKQLALLEPDLAEMCVDCYATAKDPLLGPDITFRMLLSLQKLRKTLPLELAVLSACHGQAQLAGTFLEALALATPPAPAPAPAGTVTFKAESITIDPRLGAQRVAVAAAADDENDDDWDDDDEDDDADDDDDLEDED